MTRRVQRGGTGGLQRNTVPVTASTDAWDGTFYVANTDGVDTAITSAEWVFSSGPVTLAQDGWDRELDITWDTAPQSVKITWTITDDPDLVIHALIVDPVFPSGVDLS